MVADVEPADVEPEHCLWALKKLHLEESRKDLYFSSKRIAAQLGHFDTVAGPGVVKYWIVESIDSYLEQYSQEGVVERVVIARDRAAWGKPHIGYRIPNKSNAEATPEEPQRAKED